MAYEVGAGANGSIKNGKYYLVGSNGKAPQGLNVGDNVITGGGTYQIYGFNSDGTYKSKKVSDATTYDYQSYGYSISQLPSTGGGKSNTGGVKPTAGTVNSGSIVGSGKNNNITDAQETAQKTSPATSNQRPSTSQPSYAGSGSTVTNYGQGTLSYDSNTGRIIRTMPSGAQFYVDPSDEKYNSIYAEYVTNYGTPQKTQQPQATPDDIFEEMYAQSSKVPEYTEPAENKDLTDLVMDLIGQLQNNTYQPPDTSNILNNVMSYDEAYELATSILTPQYKGLYDQAAVNSAQNLDRAGLINSLYGQQLQANARNEVSDRLMAAIPQLALELQGSDRDWAQTLLQNVVDENRYAFEATNKQLTSSASAALSLIDSIADQAARKYDYQVSRAAQQLKNQAQLLEAQYMAGTLTQQQLDTEMQRLQIEAQRLENQAAREGNKGGYGNGGFDGLLGDGGGVTQQQNVDTAVGEETATNSITVDNNKQAKQIADTAATYKNMGNPVNKVFDFVLGAAEDYGFAEDTVINILRTAGYSDAEILAGIGG